MARQLVDLLVQMMPRSGGVNFFTKPLQNVHPDDVLITDKQFKNKIRIQPDGEIFIESDNKITAIAPTIHFNP